MEEYNKKRDYKPVQSIERIFQVLEILAVNPEGLSLAALSEKTGLPGSTLHRLLHTLYALGYTEWRYSNSAPYKLTLRLFEYGNALVEHRPFIQMAHPVLDRLAEEVDLSAYIFFPEVPDMICTISSTRPSFLNWPHRGSRVPMWCSAAGKCFLSSQSTLDLEELWKNRGASFYGPNAPASVNELRRDLAAIQKKGYALSREELRVGLASMSVPLIDQNGVTFGALSVYGTLSQFAEGKEQFFAEKLKQYGRALTSHPTNC